MGDLLVLTSLDQLLFKLKILFTFLMKQPTLMWRSTVLRFPLQLVFPDLAELGLFMLLSFHLP